MNHNGKELEYLLNHYWCVKELNQEIYFNLKNNLDYYKDFIQNKLGSRLIVNDRFIKLEKIPSVPKVYMGISDFKDPMEYTLLLMVLLFLEDKPKLEQFILSNLIDFITNTATSLELDHLPDWNILHHRKCLVNVLNHLKELGIIKVVEEINTFTEDSKAEGLYETTGISNYYVREFKNNIMDYHNLIDFQNDEFNNQNENIGDVRRYRVYRHLLYSLASYTEDLSEFEIDYLRRFRANILQELGKYTAGELELTRNMAVLLFPDETQEKFDFPNNKAISDIVLLVNDYLLKKINENELELDKEEVVFLTKEQMMRILKEVKKTYQEQFSKYYRDLSMEDFFQEVVAYMKEYDFLREKEGYKLYPSVSKFIGYLQKEATQTTLFGGEIDESF